jgi:hypothetical protein
MPIARPAIGIEASGADTLGAAEPDCVAGSGATRMQRAQRCSLIFTNSGICSRHSGKASGQRVWNRQPEGGLIGLGISPVSTVLCPARSERRLGRAAIRARL